ncbi:MAG TPA: CHASE2 domain-containing protein, partial [Chthoniobacterales bacterium]
MLRPSPWLVLVVLLLGILLLREPRFAQADDAFLRWLLEHSQAREGAPLPLTVVEIGRDPLTDPAGSNDAGGNANEAGARVPPISPLEFALFLQSVLDFQPNIIAFENILKWRERDKDQEQVFLDQAMRVPKLLLAAELGSTEDPDAAWGEIRGFSQVTGKRGELAAFSGLGRGPTEDLRLISTQGFVNLPDEVSSEIRVPLLFLYRGEVIPSFALQAILLWLRVTPAEVKIELGSQIILPHERKIPIARDGTTLIDPTIAKRARRMSLNELLLAAQQRESGDPAAQQFADLRDHIVLARTPANPLSP